MLIMPYCSSCNLMSKRTKLKVSGPCFEVITNHHDVCHNIDGNIQAYIVAAINGLPATLVIAIAPMGATDYTSSEYKAGWFCHSYLQYL